MVSNLFKTRFHLAWKSICNPASLDAMVKNIHLHKLNSAIEKNTSINRKEFDKKLEDLDRQSMERGLCSPSLRHEVQLLKVPVHGIDSDQYFPTMEEDWQVKTVESLRISFASPNLPIAEIKRRAAHELSAYLIDNDYLFADYYNNGRYIEYKVNVFHD